MVSRQMVAATLVAMLLGTVPAGVYAQQGNVVLSGTGKAEAKKPYPDYSARAREIQQGQIVGTAKLDVEGKFSLSGLQASKYVVELVDPKGKVVCTEGPFDMTKTASKNDVVVDCNKMPTSWTVLAAAAAAGITTGIVAGDDPAPTAGTPSVQAASGPVSAAR